MIFAGNIMELMSNMVTNNRLSEKTKKNSCTPKNQDFAATLTDISGYF